MINMLKEMQTLKSAELALKEEAGNISNSTQAARAKIDRWEAELVQIEDEEDHLAFDRSRFFIGTAYLLGLKIEAEEQRQYDLQARYKKQAEHFRDSKVQYYDLCQKLSKSLDPAFTCIILLTAQAAQANHDLLLKLPKPRGTLDLFDISENNWNAVSSKSESVSTLSLVDNPNGISNNNYCDYFPRPNPVKAAKELKNTQENHISTTGQFKAHRSNYKSE
jgi:hypothetical protein